MKKLSKLLSILLITITLSSCFLVGCNVKKEKKYDVTIKIGCTTGESWIFTPDVEEMHCEFEYDGIERTFFVDKYKMENHPNYENVWITPSSYAPNYFKTNLQFRAPGEKNKTIATPMLEIGEYCYSVSTSSTTDLWNFRAVYLYITVT